MINRHILASWLQKAANKYQAPALLNLKEHINELYEGNAKLEPLLLAEKISSSILKTNLLQLTTDQEIEFRFLWFKAVSELS